MEIYVNQKPQGVEWCQRIYEGSFFLMSRSQAAIELGNYAEECIREHFDTPDPLTDYHDHWSVDEFIAAASSLKSYFTNSQAAKEHVRAFVVDIGEDPRSYYFDLPRLRVMPLYDYLHVGISYNYAPHRDLWYGAPACQINAWMPVFSVGPEETMAIYPRYFSRRVANTSSEFDLRHWVQNERYSAAKQKTTEARRHPLIQEEVDPESAVLLAGTRGDVVLFSGRHLHGSMPNRGRPIRFSVDFRLYLADDLRAGRGPDTLDDASTSRDSFPEGLLLASDFSPFSEGVAP